MEKGKELTQDEAIEELANMIAKDKNIKNIFDVQEVLKKSFGKVIEGLEIVHKIEEVEVKASDDAEQTGNSEVSTPVNPPKITSLKVETFGEDYGLPETLEPFDYMTWMYKQYGLDPSTLGQ